MGNFELLVKKGSLKDKLSSRFKKSEKERTGTSIYEKAKSKYDKVKQERNERQERTQRSRDLEKGINKKSYTSSGSVVRSTRVTKPKFKKTESSNNGFRQVSIRKN